LTTCGEVEPTPEPDVPTTAEPVEPSSTTEPETPTPAVEPTPEPVAPTTAEPVEPSSTTEPETPTPAVEPTPEPIAPTTAEPVEPSSTMEPNSTIPEEPETPASLLAHGMVATQRALAAGHGSALRLEDDAEGQCCYHECGRCNPRGHGWCNHKDRCERAAHDKGGCGGTWLTTCGPAKPPTPTPTPPDTEGQCCYHECGRCNPRGHGWCNHKDRCERAAHDKGGCGGTWLTTCGEVEPKSVIAPTTAEPVEPSSAEPETPTQAVEPTSEPIAPTTAEPVEPSSTIPAEPETPTPATEQTPEPTPVVTETPASAE